MKKSQNPTKLRSVLLRLLSIFQNPGPKRAGILNYWDHLITGKLGDRSRWGFDVHKYHLKNHKYARRR